MFYNTEKGIRSYLFTTGADVIHKDNHKFAIQTKMSDGELNIVRFTVKATGDSKTEFDSKAEALGILEGFAAGGRDLLAFRIFQPAIPQNQPGLVIPQVQVKGGLNG